MTRSQAMLGILVAVVVAVFGAIVYSAVTRQTPAQPQRAVAREARPLPLVEARGGAVADIARLQRAVAAKPGDAEGWSRLGTAHLHAARYPQAAEAYRRAVAIDPERSAAWSALGESYVHAIASETPSMPPQARAAFDRALAIEPNDIRARFYIALEKDFGGSHDAAVADWLGLLRMVPAGSAPDEAIRAALLDSVNRNIRLVSKAIAEARAEQPKAPPVKG